MEDKGGYMILTVNLTFTCTVGLLLENGSIDTLFAPSRDWVRKVTWLFLLRHRPLYPRKWKREEKNTERVYE